METQLLDNLKLIETDKNTNLLPENLKTGVTCLGVTGSTDPLSITNDANATEIDIVTGKTAYVSGQKVTGTFAGMDPSDATAQAKDILKGKTAYINGGKTTGTLDLTDETYVATSEDLRIDNTNVTFCYAFPIYIRQANIQAPLLDVANLIDLTPDKLVKGYTILGVEGTAGIAQTVPYTSLEELNSVVGTEGDLAVVATAEAYEGTYQYTNGAWVEIFSARRYENTITPEEYDTALYLSEDIMGGDQ